jgi:aminoglycoside phosphotransferase (APT) family kinase protein
MVIFTESNIKQTIQDILGKKVCVLPIGNHHLERNFVHYVKTDDGGTFAFKLFLKKNRWNREVASLKLLSNSDILCPKIIDYGRLEDDTEWIITNYFEGYSYRHIEHIVDHMDKLNIYRDMGKQLGKLHSFKCFDFFGNWDENGNSIDNIKSYCLFFSDHFGTVLDELNNQSLPEEKLIKKSIKVVLDNFDVISSVTCSCLCHNDFNERNVMITNRNDKWELQAIIDYEQSMPSDKDKDLAYVCYQLCNKNPAYEKAFLEGYTEFCPISKDFYDKKEFYLLYFGLYICSWSYTQAPEHYLEGIELLRSNMR